MIVGLYLDTAGLQHGFTYANGVFTNVDVTGAVETLLTRIKNNGAVTGSYVDTLTEWHGIKGHWSGEFHSQIER